MEMEIDRQERRRQRALQEEEEERRRQREQAFTQKREVEREKERFAAVGREGRTHTHTTEMDNDDQGFELVMKLIFPQILVDVLFDKGTAHIERRAQCRIDLEPRGRGVDDRVLTLTGRRPICVNRAAGMICEALEEDPLDAGVPPDKVQHVLKLMLTNDQAGGCVAGTPHTCHVRFL